MTPKWDIHEHVLIYHIWAAIQHGVREIYVHCYEDNNGRFLSDLVKTIPGEIAVCSIQQQHCTERFCKLKMILGYRVERLIEKRKIL